MSGCGTLLGSGALGGGGVRLALRRPRPGLSDGRDSLMLAIHPNARTTPAVRAEIARSSERSGVPAERYGISTETVREWRERGAADCPSVPPPSRPPPDRENFSRILKAGGLSRRRPPATPERAAAKFGEYEL